MKARDMNVSQTGVDLVKHFEGCYLKAYQDVVGVWTIGYGNTQKDYAYEGNVISQSTAERLLANDLNSHMEVPKRDITIDLNQNQYDALCSFAFNLGAHIFRNNQNLLQAINNGNWNEASRIMNLFVNAGGKPYAGLIRRRKAETELMLKPTGEGQGQNTPNTNSGYDDSWFTPQNGVFTANTTIKVRDIPSTSGGHIRTLTDGGEYTYTSYGYEAEGYVWLKGVDGTYVASGETSGGKRTSYWGSFR